MAERATVRALLLQLARQKDPDALTLAAAVRALSGAVGEPLAAHCRVAGLRDGVLQVRCDHPAVRQELASRASLADTLGVEGVSAVEFL